MSEPIPSNRLQSLDILRGLDLFLLVSLQPILVAIGAVYDSSAYHAFLHQFDHEVWEGFRLWDLIMPLFLFMTGITIPFSLDSKRALPKAPIYRHIFRRVLILWLLGMVMQGNLLGFSWKSLFLYSNTLQSIAFGYLVTSILYLHFSMRTLMWVGLALLLAYTVPFMLTHDFSQQGNFAIRVDKQLLGRFMDGVYWDEAGKWHFSNSYNYTWIWSSLTFSVTVMLGTLAGWIIKREHNTAPYRVLYKLLVIGFIALFLGCLLHYQIPIIKRIWTSSMTLFAGGICFLLMALFFYLIDVKKILRPFAWLKIYGMNSIVAYFLGEFINFRSIVHSLTFGLENLLPTYSALILTVGNVLLVFLILQLLYKNRYFVKI